MTTSTAPTTPESVQGSGSVGAEVSGYLARLRGGDTGSAPAVLGLVALVILFTVLRPESFANRGNFANLLTQSVAIIFIAMGLVFVLLLGEIDLSAGFTAGTAAAVMAVLSTQRGFPWPIALIGSIVTGAVVGLLIGLLVARLGIPSFVVSLAFFLGLQGVLLQVIGNGGTIPIRDTTIVSIMNDNLSPLLGWLLALVIVLGYTAVTVLAMLKRRNAGLPVVSPIVIAFKVGVLALLLGVATFVLNQERGQKSAFVDNSLSGVPNSVPIVVLFLVLLTFLLNRTAFGRHVYAVGGNAEAARRAGINVGQIKITCFVIGSTLAAVGGIMLASRLNSVSPQTGGSTTLLLAVAAAVIGGTSLFGGKGRVVDAVLGGLVIAVINNGLPFITQEAGVQYVVTALVLLLAASVDAIARRRALATGR